MADTAKRLFGPLNLAGVAATLYTVPALTTTIVRNFHVSNTTAGALTFNLSVGVDATGTRRYSAFSVPANSTYDWSGFWVLNAADVIQGFASGAGLTADASGVEVS